MGSADRGGSIHNKLLTVAVSSVRAIGTLAHPDDVVAEIILDGRRPTHIDGGSTIIWMIERDEVTDRDGWLSRPDAIDEGRGLREHDSTQIGIEPCITCDDADVVRHPLMRGCPSIASIVVPFEAQSGMMDATLNPSTELGSGPHRPHPPSGA